MDFYCSAGIYIFKVSGIKYILLVPYYGTGSCVLKQSVCTVFNIQVTGRYHSVMKKGQTIGLIEGDKKDLWQYHLAIVLVKRVTCERFKSFIITDENRVYISHEQKSSVSDPVFFSGSGSAENPDADP